MEIHVQEGPWPWVTGSISSALGIVLDPFPYNGETWTRGCDARQEITAQGLQFLGLNREEARFKSRLASLLCVLWGRGELFDFFVYADIIRTHCRKFNIQNNKKNGPLEY